MRTAAFILFAAVTAAVAALSTLTATRYLSLERDLSEARSRLEDISLERKRQEEEKIGLRIERMRVQSDLEARLAEQRNQLEACEGRRQSELLEISATLKILQRAVIDIQVQTGAHSRPEREPVGDAQPDPSRQAPGGQAPSGQAPGGQRPASQTDVPKGAVPTPEQEARKLQQAQ